MIELASCLIEEYSLHDSIVNLAFQSAAADSSSPATLAAPLQ
jgi:hypothetical protein